MNIMVLAHYTGDLNGSWDGRFVYLCNMLIQDCNNKVELVTSDFSHINKKKKQPDLSLFNFPVTLLHESGYPSNICAKRFISHYEFGINVKKYLENLESVPDVIYSAIPSFTMNMVAADYCKKKGVRFIIDVQDLWPEAFKLAFNLPIISNIAFAPLTACANKVYAAADEVVAVSKTYANRVMRVNRKCRKATVVYLGTDRIIFDSYANGPLTIKESGTTSEMKEKLTKFLSDKDALKLVYIGSLARSYDLISLIRAIKSVQGSIPVKLLVMGDGELKEVFQKQAEDAEIDALFTGELPYPQMVANLVQCDVAINPIHRGSAGSIINKANDYAMAGLPVINTQESEEYRELLDKYSAGINCRCEDSTDIANAIKELFNNLELREKMAKASRNMGTECFDRTCSYPMIVQCITKSN